MLFLCSAEWNFSVSGRPCGVARTGWLNQLEDSQSKGWGKEEDKICRLFFSCFLSNPNDAASHTPVVLNSCCMMTVVIPPECSAGFSLQTKNGMSWRCWWISFVARFCQDPRRTCRAAPFLSLLPDILLHFLTHLTIKRMFFFPLLHSKNKFWTFAPHYFSFGWILLWWKQRCDSPHPTSTWVDWQRW